MNTITQSEIELSERLRKACLEKGITEPRFVAQDEDGEWFHFVGKPHPRSCCWSTDSDYVDDCYLFTGHSNPDWRDTLMEWNPKAGVPLADVLQNTCEHCGNQILKSHEQS